MEEDVKDVEQLRSSLYANYVSEKNSSRQLVNSDNPALKAHFDAAVF